MNTQKWSPKKRREERALGFDDKEKRRKNVFFQTHSIQDVKISKNLHYVKVDQNEILFRNHFFRLGGRCESDVMSTACLKAFFSHRKLVVALRLFGGTKLPNATPHTSSIHISNAACEWEEEKKQTLIFCEQFETQKRAFQQKKQASPAERNLYVV